MRNWKIENEKKYFPLGQASSWNLLSKVTNKIKEALDKDENEDED